MPGRIWLHKGQLLDDGILHHGVPQKFLKAFASALHRRCATNLNCALLVRNELRAMCMTLRRYFEKLDKARPILEKDASNTFKKKIPLFVAKTVSLNEYYVENFLKIEPFISALYSSTAPPLSLFDEDFSHSLEKIIVWAPMNVTYGPNPRYRLDLSDMTKAAQGLSSPEKEIMDSLRVYADPASEAIDAVAGRAFDQPRRMRGERSALPRGRIPRAAIREALYAQASKDPSKMDGPAVYQKPRLDAAYLAQATSQAELTCIIEATELLKGEVDDQFTLILPKVLQDALSIIRFWWSRDPRGENSSAWSSVHNERGERIGYLPRITGARPSGLGFVAAEGSGAALGDERVALPPALQFHLEHLQRENLKVFPVPKDGDCFFHALFHSYLYWPRDLGVGNYVGIFRTLFSNYARDHYEQFSPHFSGTRPEFMEQCARIEREGDYDFELFDLMPRIASQCMNIQIKVYQIAVPTQYFPDERFRPRFICLFYNSRNHYSALVPN